MITLSWPLFLILMFAATMVGIIIGINIILKLK